ncbi:MAG TPA: PP2C family protein-serine/threonine phosphatase [Thermoanaerobaculia bacterium]|nr:PP2C family protein-serine/threonine phosphatase [Thermoanaerobaculia bacterium]
MNAPAIEDLVHLPEGDAARRRLDGVNWEWLKLIAAGAGALGFVALLAYLFASDWPKLVAPIATIALARGVYMAEDEGWLRRFSALAVLVLYLALWGLLVAQAPTWHLGLQIAGILAPLLALGFRLALPWALLLIALIWAGTLVPAHLLLDPRPPLLDTRAVVQTAVALVSLYFIRVSTMRARSGFLRQYRVETSRRRERQRMREELASARQIQLSMLPRHDPRIPGLDISAVSLPAAEVGGDYYEYFDQETDRFAIVVGDVAGHGVASGLLLSGIRSCLYLLHPERPSPRDLFDKLDRMVRLTTARRMFITLVYAVFDRPAGRLVLASAGHPPPLHFRRRLDRVEEVAIEAPPLGTRLEATYSEREVCFDEGDVFLFYTDGLIEALDQRGDLYGDERLVRRFHRVADSKDARAIREALLSDVWTFKGDTEQFDDITVVVVRVLPRAGAASQPTADAAAKPTADTAAI